MNMIISLLCYAAAMLLHGHAYTRTDLPSGPAGEHAAWICTHKPGARLDVCSLVVFHR